MRILVVSFAVSLLSFVGTAGAQSYSAQVLGTVSSEPNAVSGINDRGQIVGTSSNSGANPNPYAVTWTQAGAGTALTNPIAGGAFETIATAINATGQIVGFAVANQTIPILWDGSNVTVLSQTGQPLAINSSGVVVGSDGVGDAAVWSGGTRTIIGAFCTTASGINDKGIIVGRCDTTPSAERWDPTDHGFVESSLPALSSGITAAYAINNSEQVVGESGTKPVLWNGRTVQGLPTLEGGIGAALAISDAGQIVGWSLKQTGLLGEDAVTWINYKLVDLNDVVTNLDTGIHLSKAVGVNAKGQIVALGQGSGGQQLFGVLLTPVDSSAVDAPIPLWAVIALAFTLLGMASWRQKRQ
jgi:uncharacterized membrane protein